MPCIDVQAEQMRLLVRGEFCQEADRKVVLLHDVPDGRVVREASQQSASRFRFGEVGKRLDTVKRILCG